MEARPSNKIKTFFEVGCFGRFDQGITALFAAGGKSLLDISPFRSQPRAIACRSLRPSKAFRALEVGFA